MVGPMTSGVQIETGFDGIICIGGEDWWYHNRGHFDFQIMRRLARSMPVLFVNSLGVRIPTAKHGGRGQVLARIARKLASFKRGLAHVETNFHVLSPLSVPGEVGRTALGWALGPQIQWAAKRIGIRRPVLWIHCPPGAELIGSIDAVATVMQRTDRFEAFPEGDPEDLRRLIGKLMTSADLAVYCNDKMMAEEQQKVRAQLLVTHGVELERFVGAGTAIIEPPVDMAAISRPRVGFVGGIDAHTFDSDLFLKVVSGLPNANFVMVGGSSLPEGWCPYSNVHFLGRKPYDEVAAYMAACDALIMPWNQSDWIKGCNPIKLKEYLAVGRPVVTTDFPALAEYRDLVRVAGSADEFVAQLKDVLAIAHDPGPGRARVQSQSWDAKAGEVMEALRVLVRERAAKGRAA